MRAALTILLLCGAAAVSAAGIDPQSYCGPQGMPGGWAPLDVTGPQEAKLLGYADMVWEEYVADLPPELNSTCPDNYQINLLAACTQVVNGINYKIAFEVECPVGSPIPVALEGMVYEPRAATGEPPSVTSYDVLVFADDGMAGNGLSVGPKPPGLP